MLTVHVEGELSTDEWKMMVEALRGKMSQENIKSLRPEMERVISELTHRKEIRIADLRKGDVIDRGEDGLAKFVAMDPMYALDPDLEDGWLLYYSGVYSREEKSGTMTVDSLDDKVWVRNRA